MRLFTSTKEAREAATCSAMELAQTVLAGKVKGEEDVICTDVEARQLHMRAAVVMALDELNTTLKGIGEALERIHPELLSDA